MAAAGAAGDGGRRAGRGFADGGRREDRKLDGVLRARALRARDLLFLAHHDAFVTSATITAEVFVNWHGGSLPRVAPLFSVNSNRSLARVVIARATSEA